MSPLKILKRRHTLKLSTGHLAVEGFLGNLQFLQPLSLFLRASVLEEVVEGVFLDDLEHLSHSYFLSWDEEAH